MSDAMPSLNALRAFEAVSQSLSYKIAAEKLRVSPAAVKQLVSKLEDQLDVRLIRRKGHGLELTEAGKAGVVRLSDGFLALEQATALMRASVRQGTRLVISEIGRAHV